MSTQTITAVSIHHTGGIASDAFASSANSTAESINEYHQRKWNFKSMLGFYGGYNFIYDWKDRKFTQHRAIGESTVAQRGYNHNTLSLAIIGNFSLKNGISVDPITKTIEEDIGIFLQNLVANKFYGLEIAPNTHIEITYNSIHPHRFFGNTSCYGTALSDKWARDLAIKHKPQPVPSEESGLIILPPEIRSNILQILMKAFAQILSLFKAKPVGSFGGQNDRGCEVM